MGQVYKVDEIIKMISGAGWVFDYQDKSSHRHYRHPEKPGKITVPIHNKDMGKKTANSILKQAGLKSGLKK